MVRCEDDTLYTGSTTDLKKRMTSHLNQTGSGAKYTRTHPIVDIAMVWQVESDCGDCSEGEPGKNSRYSPDYILALRYEYYIKRLTRSEKDTLLLTPELLQAILEEKCRIRLDGAVTPHPEIHLKTLDLA